MRNAASRRNGRISQFHPCVNRGVGQSCNWYHLHRSRGSG